MPTTMKASVHLGPNDNDNLEANFEELKNLFDITQRLILENEAEILNVYPRFIGKSPSWTRSTLPHDQVIKWTKAKVFVSQIPSCGWRKSFRSKPKTARSTRRI